MCGLSLASVRQAAARMAGFLPVTPLHYESARRAWLKLENQQTTGSFKVRGALHALLVRQARGLHQPVVAASAGNHGAGVAWAAQRLGIPATIVVPQHTPQAKLARIRQHGAEIMIVGASFDDSLIQAKHLATRKGWSLIHAFDDPDVIAGQGTVALELLAAKPDVVVVPIGGGGLAAGMSLVLKAAGVRLVGVEVNGLNAMSRALAERQPLAAVPGSIADGLRVRRVGELTQAICREGLDEIIQVSESRVRSMMAALALGEGVLCEGAGALAVAGLDQVDGERRIALVSGGNIDLEAMLGVVQSLAPHRVAPTGHEARPMTQPASRSVERWGAKARWVTV
jgi:threonine dehydratase